MEKIALATQGYFPSRDIGMLYIFYMSIANSITQVRLFLTADISPEQADISAW